MDFKNKKSQNNFSLLKYIGGIDFKKTQNANDCKHKKTYHRVS